MLPLQNPYVRAKDTVSLAYDYVTSSGEISLMQESIVRQWDLRTSRTTI